MTERDPKSVFAANLTRLMDYAGEHGDRELATGVGLEARSGISNSAISRYRKMQVAIGVDHLQRIAQAFGLQGWQLLFPELDPANPAVVPHSPAERELYKLVKAGAELIARQKK